MKPTKNRKFCVGCRKEKMVFESQSKADNFIKYNKDEILEENDKAPVRSYFCTFCGGWHVTSNPSQDVGTILDGRDNKKINRIDEQKKMEQALVPISNRVAEKLRDFHAELQLCNYDEAEDILYLLDYETSDLKTSMSGSSKANKILRKITQAYALLKQHTYLYNLSEDDKKQLLDNPNPTKEDLKIMGIIKRQKSMNLLLSVFAQEDKIVTCEDSQLVEDIIARSRKAVKESTIGDGAHQVREKLTKKLEDILKRRQEIFKGK